MREIELPAERTIQDYRSTYNDIRDWLRREKSGKEAEESSIDWMMLFLKSTCLNHKK